MLFLKPWEAVVDATSMDLFDDELSRELAPSHPLYGHRVRAVAKNCTCDDVLYRLNGGTFAQVHLTFTKEPPELSGWPRHDTFETLADWMITVMVPNHIDHFGL